MTSYLLDGNVLVALAIQGHVHRNRCLRWFRGIHAFASCPVTEGTLLRVHMMMAADRSAAAAWQTLRAFRAHPKHQFWPNGFSYAEIDPTRLMGHRQVTDAWLARLAVNHGGLLATLDESLVALWPDATCLIPV